MRYVRNPSILTGVISPDQYQFSCKQQIPRFDIKACTQCQWSKVIRQRIHLLWSATVAKKTTRGAGSLLCCQLISKIVHIVPTTIGRFPSSHGQEIKWTQTYHAEWDQQWMLSLMYLPVKCDLWGRSEWDGFRVVRNDPGKMACMQQCQRVFKYPSALSDPPVSQNRCCLGHQSCLRLDLSLDCWPWSHAEGSLCRLRLCTSLG
jgi:hypothetical protein